MSLILEALRKSEAERQRGRLPALATGAPPAPSPRTVRAASWKWPLLGAGALALAFVAWLAGAGWTRRDVPPAPAIPAPAAVEAASAPMPGPNTAAAAGTPAGTNALPPIDRLTPRVAPAPASRDTPPPARAAARHDDAPARGPTTVTADAATTARRDAPASASARVAPASTGSTPSAATTAGLPTAAPDTVLSLADLDPATRKALPPLHVSMHLWDADPSRRFVILDGNRRAEGDRVGPAVVTDITRDGVLLEWNGRRIRVPLR
ncbi:MAG TPA: general secretion pathway protein GspB [Xanthomonadaceae bacterium]|nr:general secretion pathway protein GspB [Xanthomonadaceae bacterium]